MFYQKVMTLGCKSSEVNLLNYKSIKSNPGSIVIPEFVPSYFMVIN